jgi:hypothetical protein
VTSAEVVESFYTLQRRFYRGEDLSAQLATVLDADVAWHVPGLLPFDQYEFDEIWGTG